MGCWSLKIPAVHSCHSIRSWLLPKHFFPGSGVEDWGDWGWEGTGGWTGWKWGWMLGIEPRILLVLGVLLCIGKLYLQSPCMLLQ